MTECENNVKTRRDISTHAFFPRGINFLSYLSLSVSLPRVSPALPQGLIRSECLVFHAMLCIVNGSFRVVLIFYLISAYPRLCGGSHPLCRRVSPAMNYCISCNAVHC